MEMSSCGLHDLVMTSQHAVILALIDCFCLFFFFFNPTYVFAASASEITWRVRLAYYHRDMSELIYPLSLSLCYSVFTLI